MKVSLKNNNRHLSEFVVIVYQNEAKQLFQGGSHNLISWNAVVHRVMKAGISVMFRMPVAKYLRMNSVRQYKCSCRTSFISCMNMEGALCSPNSNTWN